MEIINQPTYEENILFEVNIDFDEAIAAWRENKKSIGNGHYKYVCTKKNKNNKNCNRECLINSDFCKMHSKTIKINTIDK